MTLEQWHRQNHWLDTHSASETEILALIESAERNVEQATQPGVSPAWQFRMAYESLLNCARAALFRSGYRVERDGGGHFRVLASLEFTLGSDSETLDLYDQYRQRRHQAVYDGVDLISESEAREILKEANRLILATRSMIDSTEP